MLNLDIRSSSLKQDVKYRGENSVVLKKEVGEWTGDKGSATAELSAVVKYLSKLNDICVAKAEPYAATVRRRTAKIAADFVVPGRATKNSKAARQSSS